MCGFQAHKEARMVRFAFKKGLRFLQKNHTFTLLRRLASGCFQLEDESGENCNLTEGQLHARWISGEWQIDEESLGGSSNVFYLTAPADLKSFPQKDQNIAIRRSQYINGIKRLFDQDQSFLVSSPAVLGPKIILIAQELNDVAPPSSATVWRWWRKYAATKCITKLAPQHHRAGRQPDATQRRIFEEVVAEVFLTPQKLPGKAVVESMERKIARFNKTVSEDQQIRAPSPATVYRWLNQLYFQVVSNARAGRTATTRELRSVIGSVKVSRILERIELDHTPCDVMIICKLTRLILGRPWITLAIDRFSRMIVGFYISFHTPSQTSVLYSLRMMIMPKDALLSRFPDLIGPWPARGLPDTIATDNGMELHGNTVESVCLEMGINLHYCGVAHPEMKGAIERAIGTVNRGLIHTLPGTTFSNTTQRGNYDSESHAAIDIDVLTHVLVKWIVDQYHKQPHKGLKGRTPLEVWQASEKNTVIELPAFPRQLDTIVGIDATRTLFHYGLEYDNLLYNSTSLQTLSLKVEGTRKLQLRAFEHDVSHIAVFHPDLKEYIDVPAVDHEYATGVNRHVHRLVCAETRKRFTDASARAQLLSVKAEIQSIVDEAMRANKVKTRKKIATLTLTDSEQVIHSETPCALAMARISIDPFPSPSSQIEIGHGDELPKFNVSQKMLGNIK
jgi:putative transposase